MDHTQNTIKQVSDDRIFILQPLPGKEMKDVAGNVDTRLFRGENKLHAVRNPQTTFWTFRYEHGMVQQPLQQSFTTWQKCYDFAKSYFAKRNIDIKEVVDA